MEFKKNDIVEVEIVDISTQGDGVGKIDGYTLFIKDTIIGDIIEAKIIKVKKNYGYARVEKVLAPSPFRVEPKCSLYRQCGGCQIQGMNYERQLLFKKEKVKHNLVAIGGFASHLIEECLHGVVGMEEPYRYRNKGQYPVGVKDGVVVVGFYAVNSHTIIPNTDCYLAQEVNKEILEIIINHIQTYKIATYNEITHEGLVRHILIRTGHYSKQIMVCLVLNSQIQGQSTYLPKQDKLIEALVKVEGMQSISVSINKEKTNVIMGKDIHTLWGTSYIEDQLKELTFQISPLSFYQVNSIQTEKLYALAVEYAGLTGEEVVWDLYCGIGTISLFMAEKACKVYGVEIVEEAIMDAKRNATLNGTSNVEFFVGRAEEVLPEKYDAEGIYADVIVVDPPRKGCDIECVQTMLLMKPKRIVYVSCDSATLARDLKILCEDEYKLEKVSVVDQFGHTVHVETICLLSKLKSDHYIEVELNMDEMDLTSAESKATYEAIREYVLQSRGLKVTNLYIAQVKDKMGIKERENFNVSKKEDAKVPQCPDDKEKAIIEAFKHFNMID